MLSIPTSSTSRRLRFLAQLAPTGAALVAALALTAAAPLAAIQFTVELTADSHDLVAGDGLCDGDNAIGNQCTLRAAIEEAEALAGADTIVFAPGTNGSPITLALGGLANVTTELTITGNGAASTILQASTCNPVTLPGACTPAEQRVLTVGTFGILKLANLTIRHGRCAGDCDLRDSGGGGILNFGALSLSAVAVSGNRSADTSGDGGGILNYQGTILSIRDSTFSGNRAGHNGGGIDNHDPDGTIGSIVRTVFSDNEAAYGGGLYAGVTDVVAHSTFSGNVATSYGGGIYADIDLGVVTDCTFDGNSSGDQGGGLYTDSPNAVGLVTRSVFTGNSSAKGGGLREFDGSMGSITNSTFSGNTATEAGGAIETRSGTIASIVNVTITGNTAPLGAGIYTESNIPISGSILGANGAGANCAGTFTDAGGNRSDDASCNGGGAIAPGTDYSLTLADNGGDTKSHALLGGSAAIDDLGACPGALGGVDQRGAPRDGNCDAGAFEAVTAYLFADGFEVGGDAAWSAAVP